MKESFRRQVEELARIREQFQRYDGYVVDYLEKFFSGNAFPQGAQSHGQTPLQIAQATTQAARQAATPGAFPHHTSTANMSLNPASVPFNDRSGTRAGASPIGSFVPPNVISNPDEVFPPSPLPPMIPTRGGYDPLGVDGGGGGGFVPEFVPQGRGSGRKGGALVL